MATNTKPTKQHTKFQLLVCKATCESEIRDALVRLNKADIHISTLSPGDNRSGMYKILIDGYHAHLLRKNKGLIVPTQDAGDGQHFTPINFFGFRERWDANTDFSRISVSFAPDTPKESEATLQRSVAEQFNWFFDISPEDVKITWLPAKELQNGSTLTAKVIGTIDVPADSYSRDVDVAVNWVNNLYVDADSYVRCAYKRKPRDVKEQKSSSSSSSYSSSTGGKKEYAPRGQKSYTNSAKPKARYVKTKPTVDADGFVTRGSKAVVDEQSSSSAASTSSAEPTTTTQQQ
jgi:hypothetical protein